MGLVPKSQNLYLLLNLFGVVPNVMFESLQQSLQKRNPLEITDPPLFKRKPSK